MYLLVTPERAAWVRQRILEAFAHETMRTLDNRVVPSARDDGDWIIEHVGGRHWSELDGTTPRSMGVVFLTPAARRYYLPGMMLCEPESELLGEDPDLIGLGSRDLSYCRRTFVFLETCTAAQVRAIRSYVRIHRAENEREISTWFWKHVFLFWSGEAELPPRKGSWARILEFLGE
ncbi:MAG: hypothetical protein JST35_07500 [Armatimonadetes bacterium]|nr:hypothetical protein [Armatimonadota bacterium]